MHPERPAGTSWNEPHMVIIRMPSESALERESECSRCVVCAAVIGV